MILAMLGMLISKTFAKGILIYKIQSTTIFEVKIEL